VAVALVWWVVGEGGVEDAGRRKGDGGRMTREGAG